MPWRAGRGGRLPPASLGWAAGLSTICPLVLCVGCCLCHRDSIIMGGWKACRAFPLTKVGLFCHILLFRRRFIPVRAAFPFRRRGRGGTGEVVRCGGAKARDKDVMMYRVFRIFVSKRKGFAGIRDGPLAHEAQTRTSGVKKRARELPYTSISPSKSRFLCGKKFASLLKEICFLPQSGGKFFAGC